MIAKLGVSGLAGATPHGYLVRAVAICISGFFALKVMFFLALLKPHTLDYVIVSIVTIFLFKGGKLVPENKFLLFRDDVQDVLRKYLSLFVASCLTAAACAVQCCPVKLPRITD